MTGRFTLEEKYYKHETKNSKTMKLRFSNNLDAIGGESEISPEEIAGKAGIERIASISKEAITIAHDIFKNHPEFKQVTLDTMTDEERGLIENSKKGGIS